MQKKSLIRQVVFSLILTLVNYVFLIIRYLDEEATLKEFIFSCTMFLFCFMYLIYEVINIKVNENTK